jgi:hypothetical protein
MTQAFQSPELAPPEPKPLNHRQRTFARELGIAIAKGGRDDDLLEAYTAAGYSRDRGNARRLAADPRIRTIADEACAEALRLAGLHIGYLQGKALELLHANPVRIHRELANNLRKYVREELEANETVALEAATWALSKFKIDKDGVISIELPDKKGIIEMLAKQLGIGKDEPGDVNVNVGLEALVTQSLIQPKEEAA